MARWLTTALLATTLHVGAAQAAERARVLAHADSGAQTAFDVFVPPAADPALDALLQAQVTPGSPQYHAWLTPAAYRARFGTDPAALSDVAAELRARGFTVQAVRAHTVRVQGSVAAAEALLSTRIGVGEFASGKRKLVAESIPTLPDALARHHALLTAFEGRIRMHKDSVNSGPIPQLSGPIDPGLRNRANGPFWFDDLKQAYDFPDVRVLDGTGVTIGILMTGDYNPPDMANYFGHENLAVPHISVRQVYGGAPYSATGSDETHLDIQQSAGMAPNADVVLYNIPDLADSSILAGLSDIDEEDLVDVVNMSFGAPETAYTAAENGGQDYTGLLLALDALFKQGNAEGITFVGSSGDAGALDDAPPACFATGATPDCGFYGLTADHPASSPYVTSVGGTNLITAHHTATDSLDSYRVRENAYYDRLAKDVYYGTPAQGAIWGSGGGVSLFEPKPAWQALAPTGSERFRTVPDVALHMGGCIHDTVQPCAPDRSSDVVGIGGRFVALHGTSASSPDFVGLIALLDQHLQSRVGNVNTYIYRLAADQRAHRTNVKAFYDHNPGDNGYYPATPGYNLVLGNGTVRARGFLGIPDAPAAGIPQSPSNP